MASTIKTLVSKKKLRYIEDGYNLDLSYISERIIAMGFPAENLEALYRNSLDEVKKFLDEKHANHYKIYNLCSEKIYDKKKFHGRVEHYPFDDHHPPTFALIGPFCEDVRRWLDEDPLNVAAVHCKAGKGRTGVMICCFLLHIGVIRDAQGVLDFYGHKRTTDEKGVTIPSQRRYIHYYDRLLHRGLVYKSVKLYLRCIVLDPVPNFKNIANDCYLTFVVNQRFRETPYESRCYVMKRTDRQVRLEVEPPLLLSDDVKIEFFTKPRLDYVGLKPKLWRKGNQEFHFWLNTFFLDADMNGGLAHDILTREHTALNTCESWSAPSTAQVSGDELAASDQGKGGTQKYPLFHFNSTSRCYREEDEEAGDEDENEDWVDHTTQTGLVEAKRRLSQHAQSQPPCNGTELLNSNHEDLMPLPHHQTVVGMASVTGSRGDISLYEMMKSQTISDEKKLESEVPKSKAKNGKLAHPHMVLTSSMSNASSSSSSSSSLAAGGSTSSQTMSGTTTTSFIDKRTRHASVPQTGTSPSSHSASQQLMGDRKVGHNSAPAHIPASTTSRPIAIGGTKIALRLNKSQIDKAAKDKQCKVYSENFNVTLFLVKPTDQSDDLIDYSQQSGPPMSENNRHITVTPVMSSASALSCVLSSGDDPLPKKKANKGSKVFRKDMNKSKLSLRHFAKRTDSSSEDESVPDSPANLGLDLQTMHNHLPPVSPKVVSFSSALEQYQNEVGEEGLSFCDPVPSFHPTQEADRNHTEKNGNPNQPSENE